MDIDTKGVDKNGLKGAEALPETTKGHLMARW